MNRILVVRPDRIGDVVLSSSFLRELRRTFPHAWITLIVRPSVYGLVELCPYVNEVLRYDGEAQGRFWRLRLHARALALCWNFLWKRRFDLAILPRWDADFFHSTFLAYWSGARRRVGFSENVSSAKKKINKGYDRLLTDAVEDCEVKHELEHNLDWIRYLGGEVVDRSPELWIGPEDRAFADEFLRGHGIHPGDFMIGLGPGSRAPKKEWPRDRFAELGKWLQERFQARILLLGGAKEKSLGVDLSERIGLACLNAAGQMTLRQSAALLERCSFYIGNDSGPAHMAAAAGIPLVVFSCHPENGPDASFYSPVRIGPYSSNCTIIRPKNFRPPCEGSCAADRPHCILGISLHSVQKVVAAHWEESPVWTRQQNPLR